MLKRQEFREFAEKINKAMEWQFFGLELLSYALVALFTPPFAAHVMVSRTLVLNVKFAKDGWGIA